MGKLWKVSPDEKLAVVPQRAHGKLMVGKGSGIHIYPPRWTQAPSIHPLDSEDGYYVGIITAPAGAMASSRRKCQGGCSLIVRAQRLPFVLLGPASFGDFRKSGVFGRVKSG